MDDYIMSAKYIRGVIASYSDIPVKLIRRNEFFYFILIDKKVRFKFNSVHFADIGLQLLVIFKTATSNEDCTSLRQALNETRNSIKPFHSLIWFNDKNNMNICFSDNKNKTSVLIIKHSAIADFDFKRILAPFRAN